MLPLSLQTFMSLAYRFAQFGQGLQMLNIQAFVQQSFPEEMFTPPNPSQTTHTKVEPLAISS